MQSTEDLSWPIPTPPALRLQWANQKKQSWGRDGKQQTERGESHMEYQVGAGAHGLFDWEKSFSTTKPDRKIVEHTKPITEVTYGQKQSPSILSAIQYNPSHHPFTVPHRVPQPTPSTGEKLT